MALKKPNSVEECVYFTNRIIDSGRAIAWVFRKECPKCKKGIMGKPQKKGGKADLGRHPKILWRVPGAFYPDSTGHIPGSFHE